MDSKLNDSELNSVHVLKLYSKLKRVIYRASSIDTMLGDVCRVIADQSFYNYSWILFSENDNNLKLYSSNNHTKLDCSSDDIPCYNLSANSEGVVVIKNKKEFCDSCEFKTGDDNIIFSSQLKFKGAFYGTFSVNVLSRFSQGEEHKQQFVELAEDLSYAIYNLKLEETLDKERRKMILLQNRTQSFLMASPNAVIISDLDMNVTFVSEKVQSIFGVSISSNSVSLSDYHPSKVLSRSEYKKLINRFNRLVNREVEYVESVYFPKIKGIENLIIKIRSTVVLDSKGVVNGVISFIEDYSKTAKRENELAFFEKKFSTVFKEAPTGISLLNPFGNYIDANEMECKILGYEKNELIGKNLQDLFATTSKKEFDNHFFEFNKTGVKELDVEMKKKNGDKVIVRKSGKAIYDDNGNIITIVVHSRDYTEVIAAQNRIKTLSKALNQSPSIIVITDLNGNITYVNQQFEKTTGYSLNDVEGKNARILKSGFYNEKVYKRLWTLITNGEEWNGRFLNLKKNGEEYWEHALISPFIDENGKITGYIKSGEDISTLVEVENKLSESNERYQKILELVPIPIVVYQKGIILEANKAALEFSKAKSKEKFIGSNISNYIESKNLDVMLSVIDKMTITGESALATETKFYNLEGDLRTVSVVTSPFLYKGEQSIMAAFMDITEKNNWLSKLRESESKFRSIFNTNPNSITLSRSEDGMFLEVNQGFCRITGYTEDEVVGRKSSEINIFADVNDRDELLADVAKNGIVDGREIRFRLKNGSVIFAIVSSTILDINNEKVLLIVAQDISNRKIMEKELLDAKIKAEENDKLKSAFLANMSHEIRNPMNAIIGFSDLLKDEGLTHQEQTDYINIIQSKGDELMLLINDIIDVSKIESGLLEVELDDINVNDYLNSLKNDFTKLVSSKSHGNVKFVVNNNGSKDLFVLADFHRLNQVFYNLISNAIKFTNTGEISISYKVAEKNVIFYVSDTGIGIPEEKLELIFDRFSQVNQVKDALVGGTGLGLSITKSLMELMNSSVSVKSTIGKGATFVLSLPKSRNKKTSLKSNTHNNSNQELYLLGKNIAVIENDISSLAYIQKLLKTTNASISPFENLDDFRSWFSVQDNLEMIIIETKFISSDSMECFSELKHRFPLANIIGVSADIVENKELDKIKLKLDSFLSKPYTKADMYKAISKLF